MKAIAEKTQPIIHARKQKRFSIRTARFWAQLFAAAVTVWIGIEFVIFVRYIESGGQGMQMPRPPGVEAFLPISGLISFRDWLLTGVVNAVHPASMIILLVVVATALLFKKAFCSWVCPVGFISEMIANIGDRMAMLTGIRKRLKLPRPLDYLLRSIKYLLLAFFLYAVFIAMSPEAIKQFVASPYNKVADIKMLKFFTEIDSFALWTIVGLFVFSIILRGFWCRYLCPYGALLGLASLVSPARIRRDATRCIDCGKCARVCPAFIKVDKVSQVTSDECSGCLDCVAACPVTGALNLGVAGTKRRVSSKTWVYALILVFWGSLLLFKLTGPWQNAISRDEYIYHVTQMDGPEYYHPGR